MTRRLPRAVAVVVGAVGLATLALTVAGRIAFPWPLEWMEGGTLHHALRLLRGERIYDAPTAVFVPYLYPPLAYVPMAGAIAVFGANLLAARLVSVVSTLGILALLARSCSRRAGRLGGWAAAGTFAAGFGYAGGFLDLARVDAFFLLLVIAGAERLDAGRSRTALALLVAACFAKQHGVWLLAAASAWLVWTHGRRAWRDVAVAWVAVVAAYAALTIATDGWFHRYVYALPASHPVEPTLFVSFFVVDVPLYLPVLTIVTLLAMRERAARRDPLVALLAAALVAGALGRAHPGGHDNVRLAAFALLVAVAVPPLVRALTASLARTRMLAALGLASQLAILWQPPAAHHPSPQSTAGYARLHEALQACARGGRAVALDHALFAGAPSLHTMALSDLRMGGGDLAVAGTTALLGWLSGQSRPGAIAVGESFDALDRRLAQVAVECARVPTPTPATGYTPGRRVDGRRWQIVHTTREQLGVHPEVR